MKKWDEAISLIFLELGRIVLLNVFNNNRTDVIYVKRENPSNRERAKTEKKTKTTKQQNKSLLFFYEEIC